MRQLAVQAGLLPAWQQVAACRTATVGAASKLDAALATLAVRIARSDSSKAEAEWSVSRVS